MGCSPPHFTCCATKKNRGQPGVDFWCGRGGRLSGGFGGASRRARWQQLQRDKQGRRKLPLRRRQGSQEKALFLVALALDIVSKRRAQQPKPGRRVAGPSMREEGGSDWTGGGVRALRLCLGKDDGRVMMA